VVRPTGHTHHPLVESKALSLELGAQVANQAARLNLLDFGCIRIFPPTFVDGVLKLYRALIADDRDAQAEAYRIWGFTGLTRPLIESLNIWARFIYGPLLEDRVRTVADGVSGFVLRAHTAAALVEALDRAIAGFGNRRAWQALQLAGMRQDFSWDRSAREYVKIYERVLAGARR